MKDSLRIKSDGAHWVLQTFDKRYDRLTEDVASYSANDEGKHKIVTDIAHIVCHDADAGREAVETFLNKVVFVELHNLGWIGRDQQLAVPISALREWVSDGAGEVATTTVLDDAPSDIDELENSSTPSPSLLDKTRSQMLQDAKSTTLVSEKVHRYGVHDDRYFKGSLRSPSEVYGLVFRKDPGYIPFPSRRTSSDRQAYWGHIPAHAALQFEHYRTATSILHSSGCTATEARSLAPGFSELVLELPAHFELSVPRIVEWVAASRNLREHDGKGTAPISYDLVRADTIDHSGPNAAQRISATLSQAVER